MSAAVLGLDIGGANLKAAHTDQVAASAAFALWRDPAGLVDALRQVISPLPPFDRLAVTMTGELCDCWESKRQGVEAILDAVAQVAGKKPIDVWTNQGAFVSLSQARSLALAVASANWLALVRLAGRLVPSGPALLLDIGTTTTDIIPLEDGRPTPRGLTDPQRLASGELLYAGWKRTPACALLGTSHAAEFFATMHDAYLVLRQVPDAPQSCDTADRRPATQAYAYRRLARMLLADLETSTVAECDALAQELHFQLIARISQAVENLTRGLPLLPQTLLVSGSGEFLLPAIRRSPLLSEELRRCRVVSLAERLGPGASAAACAFAVAVLSAEQEA